VQDYIAQFGVRKCEANALVPEVGRQLCRDAITEFIPADAPRRYRARLARARTSLQREIRPSVGEA
jgi:hypothetical protein